MSPAAPPAPIPTAELLKDPTHTHTHKCTYAYTHTKKERERKNEHKRIGRLACRELTMKSEWVWRDFSLLTVQDSSAGSQKFVKKTYFSPTKFGPQRVLIPHSCLKKFKFRKKEPD